MGESRKTVEFMSSLDDKTYKKVAYWNLFGRKLLLPGILIVMYAYGAFSIVRVFKVGMTYGSSQFVTLLCFAVLGFIMPTLVLVMNERRMRKEMKSHNIPEDTRKFIRMVGDEISLLRMKKNEMLEYTWKEVDGIYPFPARIIFAMKDKQIFMADSQKISDGDRLYIMEKAQENHVVKRTIEVRSVVLAGIFISAVAAGIGWLI